MRHSTCHLYKIMKEENKCNSWFLQFIMKMYRGINGRTSGSGRELQVHRTSWTRSDGDQQPAGFCRTGSRCPWSPSWKPHPHLQHDKHLGLLRAVEFNDSLYRRRVQVFLHPKSFFDRLWHVQHRSTCVYSDHIESKVTFSILKQNTQGLQDKS